MNVDPWLTPDFPCIYCEAAAHENCLDGCPSPRQAGTIEDNLRILLGQPPYGTEQL